MKLLLTSGGLTNRSLCDTLRELVLTEKENKRKHTFYLTKNVKKEVKR